MKNKKRRILKNNFIILELTPNCILKNIKYCIFKKGQNPDTVYLNENIYKKVNEREQS